MLIKGINKLKRKEEPAPEPEPQEPVPTAEELLLSEIRDLLKEKNGAGPSDGADADASENI